MGRFEDLTGMKFGRLTVIGLSAERKNGRISWLCICECGEKTNVLTGQLKSGGTKSCGCLSADEKRSRLIDLTGERFGRWTVVRITDEMSGTAHKYECLCDCGNVKIVSSSVLVSGDSRSCGCLQKDIAGSHRKDLSGQKFGRLTAIRIVGTNSNNACIWECRCDCGAISRVVAASLINGGIQSCGCLSRDKARERLTIHGLSYTPEYKRAMWKRRREKERINDSEWTLEMDREIFNFFSACVVCGSEDELAVDHVMPLDNGFGLIPGNAVRLCKKCNSAKKNRSLDNLPRTMPSDAKKKILRAAHLFKEYWESLTENSGKPT